MSKDELEFVIYIIHACSQKWELSPSAVYRRLQSVDCIDKYLIGHYEILHTQSTAFVVEDVERFLQNRGKVA